VPHLAFQADAMADIPILPMEEVETAYYLRMQAEDQPGVLADVTRILGEAGISIEAIIQKEQGPDADHVPVIMLTHRVREGKMNEAIRRIENLGSINGTVTRIRVEYLNKN
jgi:homoserine dehydrogenase